MTHIGHLGMVRMKRALHKCYWWPGLDSQAETAVCSCPGCQMSVKTQPPDLILPTSIPKPDVTWKRLGLDLAGPYSTIPHRQQFIISTVNCHSDERMASGNCWHSIATCLLLHKDPRLPLCSSIAALAWHLKQSHMHMKRAKQTLAVSFH